MRRLDHRGQVDHLEGRVGRRLEPDEGGVVARCDQRLGIGDVDEPGLEPAAGLEVGELHDGAVVGVPGRDHGRALPDQVEQRRGHGEPAGEGQRAAALEGARAPPRRRSRWGSRSGRTPGHHRRRTSTPGSPGGSAAGPARAPGGRRR